MIVNKLNGLDPKINLSIQLVGLISDNKILAIKHGNTGKKVLLGLYNALSGGRANMNSSSVKLSILHAQKSPSWPKEVKLEEHKKGLMLVLSEPKEETEA